MTGTLKCEICREVLPSQFCLTTFRNLCSLELPGYPSSTKNEVNLSPPHDYNFLSCPKVEALQGYLLSSHGWCWTLNILYLTMVTHFSVGLKVSAVEIPGQK